MSTRSFSTLLLLFLSCTLFAQTSVEMKVLLRQPNVICGIGEARTFEKADKKACEDLATFIKVDVSSHMTTTSNNEDTRLSSKVESSTSVSLFNARRYYEKKGGKYIVYRYIILDDPYSKYTINETKPEIKEEPTRNVTVASNRPVTVVKQRPRVVETERPQTITVIKTDGNRGLRTLPYSTSYRGTYYYY